MDSECGQVTMKGSGPGYLWVGEDHKNQLGCLQMLPMPAGVKQSSAKDSTKPEYSPELPVLIDILAGGPVLRGNLAGFLDPHQKTCF